MNGHVPARARAGIEGYSYAGRHLTPAIITGLAPRLITGESFKRLELIAVVEEYHVSRGGLWSRSDPALQVKKALISMAQRGVIVRGDELGTWRWVEAPDQERGTAPDPGREFADGEDQLQPESCAGEERRLPGSLYAYYFPTYRGLAEAKGESFWPIKVGMTTADNPAARIAQQSAAMPEKPVLAYARRTATPARLEKAVHCILSYRGRLVEEASGSEWYRSNPQEIREIVSFIHGKASA